MPESQPGPRITKTKTGPPRLLVALAVLGVLVPILVWRDTWFGRKLTDQQLEEYLDNTDRPRKTQHALSQLAERLARGDASAEKYYPRIASLARHEETALRTTAAWVMGQDNRSELFHRTLLEMLSDPELMVRRNAALSLVRFADSRGRPVLVQMLVPLDITAPVTGIVSAVIEPGQKVGQGALLARIAPPGGDAVEVRSPSAGTVSLVHRADGEHAAHRDPLLELDPDLDQVWESLRGLYFVGLPDDLPLVDQYRTGLGGVPDHVQEQAVLTAQAIRTRSGPGPSQ